MEGVAETEVLLNDGEVVELPIPEEMLPVAEPILPAAESVVPEVEVVDGVDGAEVVVTVAANVAPLTPAV